MGAHGRMELARVPALVVPASDLEAALLASYERLWRTCRRLTRSEPDAEDLLQETLARALSRPPSDVDRDLGPWLDQVARNLAIDRHRTSGRVVASTEIAEVHSDQGGGNALAHSALVEGAANAWLVALATLPPLQRSVLLLRDVLEHDTAETARLLGIREGAARTALHRARQAMQGTSTRVSSADLLRQLADSQITSLADLVAAGRQDRKPILLGPAAPAVWRTLLDLLVAAAGPELLQSRAHALYLQGSAATADGAHPLALDLLDQALAEAQRIQDRRLTGLIQYDRYVAATRMNDIQRAREALQAMGRPRSRGERTRWLASAGTVAYRSGDAEAASQAATEALAANPDARTRAFLLQNLALYENQRGHYAEALTRAERAITELVEQGDLASAARAWNTRGMVLQNLGEFEAAESSFQEAVTQAERHGACPSSALNNLALLRMEQRRWSEASELLLRARAKASGTTGSPSRNAMAFGRPLGVAITTANQGLLAHLRGARDEALRLLDEAVAVTRELGNVSLLAHCLAHRAALVGRMGGDPSEDLAEARALARPEQEALLRILATVAGQEVPLEDLAEADGLRRCTTRLALLLLDVDELDESSPARR